MSDSVLVDALSRFAAGEAAAALIAGSYACYRSLGSDLLPGMDEGGFILDYIMPAGASLESF